jgi:type IX secretion system PorP/SprF family membrane protein
MTKNLVKGILALALTVSIGTAKAQDVHFSQYYASPLLLNPALAGMSTCDYRVYANFRMQWPTVSVGNTYRTTAAGADMAIGKVTKYNSFAGLGLSFVSDQAGDLNLSTNRVDLSFAYHFMLNRRGTMQLSTGLQGSFYHRSINPAKATFDSQYDPLNGTVDPNGLKESFGRTRVLFGDAGLGMLFSALSKKNANYYLGFALSHINQPRISFRPSGQDGGLSGAERLYMKISIHGGISYPIGERFFVMPHFLALIQGPSYEFNVGCNFKSLLGNSSKTSKTALTFGAQYRGLIDALIVSARVDYKGFGAGLSYDVNFSKLLPASSSVGAPEISLIYQGCARKKPKPGHCPVMF